MEKVFISQKLKNKETKTCQGWLEVSEKALYVSFVSKKGLPMNERYICDYVDKVDDDSYYCQTTEELKDGSHYTKKFFVIKLK